MEQNTLVAILAGFASMLTAVGVYIKNKNDGAVARLKEVQATYANMIERQVELLIEPLEKEVSRLRDENNNFKARITELENQVDRLMAFKMLFGRAIQYIRELCHYISTLPGIDGSSKPHCPKELKEHIEGRK